MRQTHYPGKVNSPETTTTSTTVIGATSIAVLELSVFPVAPNLAVLGTGEDAETVLYSAKSAASGAGTITVTRAFQGTAKEWDTGTPIARNFTEYDLWALQQDIVLTRQFVLSADSCILGDAHPPLASQDELTTHKFPLPKIAFTKSGAGTEEIFFKTHFSSDFSGIVSAYLEFEVSTAVTSVVSFLVYAQRFDDTSIYDVSLPLVATFSKTMDGSGPTCKYISDLVSFSITGTGNTILWRLIRNGNGDVDTYTTTANFITISGTYGVE
jgi:hypothetical protein